MSSSHDTNHTDVMDTIQSIRRSESQAEQIVADAKVRAEHIVHKAKQETALLRNTTQEESVKIKNELIVEGAKSIESEVDALVAGANKESASLAKRALDPKQIPVIVRDVLFGSV